MPLILFDENLDTAITNFPPSTVVQLAETFSDEALGFITKLNQWVSHQLIVRQVIPLKTESASFFA